MKIQIFSSLILTTIALAVARTAAAQDAIITVPTPTLSYGVQPVVELAQAKVADDVIVRYIHNSGTIFTLKSSEIVYLKQQGVSDTVLAAMLDQRVRLTGSTEPATTVVTVDATGTATASTAVPTVVIQQIETPAPTVYVIPDTQTARYNGLYGYPYGMHYTPRYGNGFGVSYSYCYPAVSVVHIGASYGAGYGYGYGHSHFHHY